MEFHNIIYELRDQIGRVTFNRPESMNAINGQMSREIIDACREADEDGQVRVVVFTGAGEKAFSAGMDLKERASGTTPTYLDRRQRKLAPVISTHARAVASISKPTIAAVRGYCLGGGLEMALACDFRFASEDAKLGLTEVRMGLIPGAGGTQRLTRLVGPAKALEICMTGDAVSGVEAHRIGIVNDVVPAGALMKRVEEFAGRLIKGAPISLSFLKEAIYKGSEMPLDDGLRLEADLSALIATTEDSKEGPRAFVEKRAPIWKGK